MNIREQHKLIYLLFLSIQNFIIMPIGMIFTLKEKNKKIWLSFNDIVRFLKNEDGSCTIITENESICVKNSFESIWNKLKEFELTI